MAIELITEKVWQHLTSAIKKSNRKSFVAVAYFGQGGANMLPLSEGSILLVDASEKAVKSGQTCPAELILLYNKGVHIYSLENLHAKVFVHGNSLFIGSTNVSGRSSTLLTEALIKTNDRKSIADAVNFIKSKCVVELGIEELSILSKKYISPKPFGGKHKKSNLSNFYTCQLAICGFSKDEKAQSKLGKVEAEKRLVSKERHKVEEFLWYGKFTPKKKDIIVEIVEDNNGTKVFPPSRLIHTRKWRTDNKNKTLCYIEVPNKKKRNLKEVHKKLNANERKAIKRNGKMSRLFAEKINVLWNI